MRCLRRFLGKFSFFFPLKSWRKLLNLIFSGIIDRFSLVLQHQQLTTNTGINLPYIFLPPLLFLELWIEGRGEDRAASCDWTKKIVIYKLILWYVWLVTICSKINLKILWNRILLQPHLWRSSGLYADVFDLNAISPKQFPLSFEGGGGNRWKHPRLFLLSLVAFFSFLFKLIHFVCLWKV